MVEGVEVEGDTGAASYCDEVDEAVGRPSDGLKDDHRVADGRRGDEVAGLGRPGDGDFSGALAAGFSDAAAIGEWSWRGGAEGERETDGFDDAGHRAGRTHDGTGA